MQPILVIMAAGLGSRYGGLKQIDPVDVEGQLIIDFSVFDAARSGFSKIVCIIKSEMEAEFEEVIGRRIRPRLALHYAHQRLDRLPPGFAVPPGRIKPWGTAHALMCAAPEIDGPFAVINADDFYGLEAFQRLAAFLSGPHAASEHAMVGYAVENTLTENGTVARGICEVEDGFLRSLAERTRVKPWPGGAVYSEEAEDVFLPAGTTVSMNCWGFQPSILGEMEGCFADFLRGCLPENPLKCEYFLPTVPNRLVQEGRASVEVLKSRATWYGVTYREDMPRMRAAVARMKAQGLYPGNLWRDA